MRSAACGNTHIGLLRMARVLLGGLAITLQFTAVFYFLRHAMARNSDGFADGWWKYFGAANMALEAIDPVFGV